MKKLLCFVMLAALCMMGLQAQTLQSSTGLRVDAAPATAVGSPAANAPAGPLNINWTWGDEMSYCDTNANTSVVGNSAGNPITFGVKFPASYMSGRNYLSDVSIYNRSNTAGNYTLYVCQTTSGGTPNLSAPLYTYTYTLTGTGSYVSLPLNNTIALDNTKDLWIIFNAAVPYAIPSCAYTGDTNGSLIYSGGSWLAIQTVAPSLNYTWMIKATTSATAPNVSLAAAIEAPTYVGTGDSVTLHAIGTSTATYSWVLNGATPATATGTTARCVYTAAGDYTAIVTATLGSQSVSDTATIHVLNGNEMSYCGNAEHAGSVGGLIPMVWGTKLPAASLAGRQYLTNVLAYDALAGAHTLYIYQTNSGSTPHLDSAALYTANYTFTGSNEYTLLNLAGSVILDTTKDLWVVLSCSVSGYPSAGCDFSGDSNGSLVYYQGTWATIQSLASTLNYTWMIKAFLANSVPLSVGISAPERTLAGNTITLTAYGLPTYTYSWILNGATPATATGQTVTCTYANGGDYDIICTATLGSQSVSDTATIHVTACTPQALPFTCGFESTDMLDCWNFIDADNDGYSWDLDTWQGSDYAHSGSGVIGTASYINNVGVLTPDQWMITPELVIPTGGATLTYWVGGVSEMYGDKYSVYVSTTGASPSDFTGSTPLLTEAPAVATYAQKSIDLAAYAGQTIRIGFRHYDSEDGYWLLFDDIAVMGDTNANPPQQYTITATANNAAYGTVTGGGQYNEGATCTLTATPNAGYRFQQWDNGDTAAVISFTVTEDLTIVATFVEDSTPATEAELHIIAYLLNEGPSDIVGRILVNGQQVEYQDGYYAYAGQLGDTVTLTAEAAPSYNFVNWSTGDSNATITFVLEQAVNQITCNFDFMSIGISDVPSSSYTVGVRNSSIIVRGAEQQTIRIFDAVGRLIVQRANAGVEETFQTDATGIYLVQVGNAPARRVTLLR